MDYIIDHLDKEKTSFIHQNLKKRVYKRPGKKINVTSLTIHSTANPNSTARNERDWLDNKDNNRWASYHIVIDDTSCIEVIPLNEIAYHCGNDIGNRTSIGIELCESGNREAVLDNACQVIVDLMYLYGLSIDNIFPHRYWDKTQVCPRILQNDIWDNFIKRIKIKIQPTVSKYAEEDWKWAVANKICDGSNPKGNITREQAVCMISRAITKLEFKSLNKAL